MQIVQLTRDLAAENVEAITALLDRIPGYTSSPEEVLAEDKRGLPMTAKWDLSLLAQDDEGVAAIAIRYRRPIELPHYPAPTVYGNGLAVRANLEGTGVGRAIFDRGLEVADQWIAADDPGIRCSLQTNAAPFNNRVRAFYARRGFVVVGQKEYENRTDVVMVRNPVPPNY